MKRFLLTLAAMALSAGTVANAQTITRMTHPAPDGAETVLLLTDGRALVQGFNDTDWWTLTPDINGSYLNGTWTQVASLPSGYAPYAQAQAVLADGRVIVEGGEYNFGSFAFTNQGAVYDPQTNIWTQLTPPPQFDFIGDSPSIVMPNGKFIIGQKMTMRMAELDPKTMAWTPLASTGKSDWNAEEGWTLLPNGTFVTADVLNSPNSEHYDRNTQTWIQDGSTKALLMGPPEVQCLNGQWGTYCPPGEIGPAVLRPDGTVFATGALHVGEATGHTAVYTPSSPTQPGTWVKGPDFPGGDFCDDDFAALLPNGNVLVSSVFNNLYEFNGTTMTKTGSGGGSLLVLPTGEIMVAGSKLYKGTGTYQQVWAPMLFPLAVAALQRGKSYTAYGSNFNGMSEAHGFGDEFQTATNYPLVRLTNIASGHVFYARTHDHSTMGVRHLGSLASTHFDVPANAETGSTKMEVVANGIPSNVQTVMVF